MAKNNYARLKQEADIETVVNYLGIPVRRKGTSCFLLCPLPQHADRHATNCYFKPGWNNLYCTACGSAINAIDLIIYTLGVEYGKAADILWELEGRPDWYYTSRMEKKKEVFHLSKEEADLLGIHSPGYILTPFLYSDAKPNYGHDVALKCDADGYLACKMNHLTWKDFMTEEQYRSMVKEKAIERGRKAQEVMLRCNSRSLKNAFYTLAVECKTLSERA